MLEKNNPNKIKGQRRKCLLLSAVFDYFANRKKTMLSVETAFQLDLAD